jgi:hypothetical protein
MAITIRSAQTIRGGITLQGNAPSPIDLNGLQLYLDAGNIASYPGSGTSWTDLIASRTFTLLNGPTYDSNHGGSIQFTASASNYANCSSSLPTLTRWSVEVWHYYDGTNTGSAPTIITEVYPGITGTINYVIGTTVGPTGALQAGFYSGWSYTGGDYFLTPNTWNHIVGTFDGSTLKLYVNGTLVRTNGAPDTCASSNGGINLMKRWDNPDFWGGKLAVVRIYNNDIGQSGVDNNLNAERGRFGL